MLRLRNLPASTENSWRNTVLYHTLWDTSARGETEEDFKMSMLKQVLIRNELPPSPGKGGGLAPPGEAWGRQTADRTAEVCQRRETL